MGAEDVDLEPGDTLETPARTLTEADVVNFAGVSGDFNHLHTDAEKMADSAFGERVVHGALVFSVMTGLLWRARDDGAVFYGVDELRWVASVFIGDTVHVEMEVLSVEDADHQDSEALVRQKAEVVNQDGDVVLACKPLSLI